LLDNLDFGVGLFWSPNTLWTIFLYSHYLLSSGQSPPLYYFLTTTDLMIDDRPMKNLTDLTQMDSNSNDANFDDIRKFARE